MPKQFSEEMAEKARRATEAFIRFVTTKREHLNQVDITKSPTNETCRGEADV